MNTRFRIFAALAALLTPATAWAAGKVTLSSTVFVERDATDARGRHTTILESPKTFASGDRLVFLLDYRNAGAQPASDVVVTNPVPRGVTYRGTNREALVSIDGGRRWGRLATLKVTERDGTVRAARTEDVTHIRWSMKQPVPAGYGGKLTFRGIVR